MEETKYPKIEVAKKLMDDFSQRTGITGDNNQEQRRYLWTDAFAVQSFFGLSHCLKDDSYRDRALKLIDLVHLHLGQHHPDDSRKGWISGLSDEEARKHPTAGGLRIGKDRPERRENEAYNERLEWEQDGQYFHYITRWINALLQAYQETGDSKYAGWAAELMQASGKFIRRENGRLRMFWKMSTDLSRPLVSSMGAHDPLEGLLCVKAIRKVTAGKGSHLESLEKDFNQLCAGQDWHTTDALGIGALLLNSVKAASLDANQKNLPTPIKPEKLLRESLESLQAYSQIQTSEKPADYRLAFRECGLSLGVRVCYGAKENLPSEIMNQHDLEKYLTLSEEIEDFWTSSENRQAATWQDHLDINAVSLASSLIATDQPQVFGGLSPEQGI